MKVRKDPAIPLTPDSDSPGPFEEAVIVHKRPTASPEAEKTYITIFFKYFHHRWPIAHRPSCCGPDLNSSDLLRQCAMRMIGAWIYAGGESTMYSMVMHDYLMTRLPGMLVFFFYTHNSQMLLTQPSSKRSAPTTDIKEAYKIHCVRQHYLS